MTYDLLEMFSMWMAVVGMFAIIVAAFSLDFPGIEEAKRLTRAAIVIAGVLLTVAGKVLHIYNKHHNAPAVKEEKP